MNLKNKAMIVGDAVQLSAAFVAIGVNSSLFSDISTGAGGMAAGILIYATGLALTARSVLINQEAWDKKSTKSDNTVSEPSCLVDALLSFRKNSKDNQTPTQQQDPTRLHFSNKN